MMIRFFVGARGWEAVLGHRLPGDVISRYHCIRRSERHTRTDGPLLTDILAAVKMIGGSYCYSFRS